MDGWRLKLPRLTWGPHRENPACVRVRRGSREVGFGMWVRLPGDFLGASASSSAVRRDTANWNASQCAPDAFAARSY